MDEDPSPDLPPAFGRYTVMRGNVLVSFNVEEGRNRLAIINYLVYSHPNAA